MKTSKNKIRTAGYFIKRLRDSGFIVIKSFFRYAKSDPRRWTVIVDPSNASVFITCFTNKNSLGEVLFKLDDGDQKIPGSMYLKTDSIEVVISYLISKGVSNDNKNSIYIKKPVSITNEI
jgi:hypothetical protein